MKIDGTKLREQLITQGMQPKALSIDTQLSMSTIRRALNGTCSHSNLQRICNILDIDIQDVCIDSLPLSISYLNYISATPYLSVQDLADYLNLSTSTISARKRELETFNGRYGETSVIKDGGIVLINVLCMLDYLKYRSLLSDETTRKYVPAFNPYQWAHAIGWYGDKSIKETEE
ncbi:MAG: helix-turn-helix domain-containing protein [Lachnospiraceae bacterium]|nr:helix-turn-helix domain-containing protein [Lachnospiraceae bacterium]